MRNWTRAGGVSRPPRCCTSSGRCSLVGVRWCSGSRPRRPLSGTVGSGRPLPGRRHRSGVPSGGLRVVATNQRLLVFHQGAWASVWLPAIRQLHPFLEAQRLELVFEDDPPYALAGPWVPYLAVVMTAVLAAHRGTATVTAAVAPA